MSREEAIQKVREYKEVRNAQFLTGVYKAPSTPATMSKQRSTLSKQHSTLLPQTATMLKQFIVKFRPFDKVETN